MLQREGIPIQPCFTENRIAVSKLPPVQPVLREWWVRLQPGRLCSWGFKQSVPSQLHGVSVTDDKPGYNLLMLQFTYLPERFFTHSSALLQKHSSDTNTGYINIQVIHMGSWFWDKTSLCRHGWPWIHNSTWVSHIPGLQAYSPRLILLHVIFSFPCYYMHLLLLFEIGSLM